MAFIDWLKSLISSGAPDNRPVEWPPPHLKAEWRAIEGYVRRYQNDRDELLKNDPEFKNADDEKKSLFTPVPLAAEMARLSSQLLFSAEPKLVNEADQDLLDDVVKANGTGAFLLDAGEHVAVQGYGALRVIRDEEVSDFPLVTHNPANKTVFRVRHGRFVTGGYVVVERRPDPFKDDLVYRLVEDHRPNQVERAVYKGNRTSLGQTIPHAGWPEEWAGLSERTDHRMNAPTLYRWDNVPGGWSDLSRLGVLFDRLNEAESVGVDKLRMSVPIAVVDRKISDRRGKVPMRGVILTGGNVTQAGESLAKTVETIQREMDAEAHKLYVSHLRDSILMYAGYSLASWGLDDGGSADSGKALRLRQARTLLTKAGKDRTARDAITAAFAAACAWHRSASDVAPFEPDLQLGDGLPRDPLEDAQVVATKRAAEVESLETSIRELHPDWDQAAIEAEVGRLEKEKASLGPPGFAEMNPNLETQDEPEEEE